MTGTAADDLTNMTVTATVAPDHDCADMRRGARKFARPIHGQIQRAVGDAKGVTQPAAAPRDAATIPWTTARDMAASLVPRSGILVPILGLRPRREKAEAGTAA